MFQEIRFSDEKNLILKQTRGVCFDDVIEAIDSGKILDDLEHYSKDKYPNQKVLVIEFDSYAYVVPYVVEKKEGKYRSVFLKTIFPSRKFTRKYVDNE